jgi:branched-chain amino acid aminotransferase
MSRYVYLNGRFVPEPEARVSIYDSALVLGDMAYEVTRTFNHRPYRLREHLERLSHSLGAMHIDPHVSLDELTELTDQTLRRNLPTEADDVDWNIIHNVSRGPAAGFFEAFPADERRPTVAISCYPLTAKMAALAGAYTTGLDAVVPRQRSIPGDLIDAHVKSRSRLHYQLANLEASAKLPGSLAILTDPEGYLTEGTSGNVFLARGGELQTPEPRNLLPGITRGVVLNLAKPLGIPSRELDITPADALQADEMFVTSTSIGIIHIRSFEGQTIGSGQLGPISSKLRAALNSEVGLDFAAQARHYAARRA